MLGAVDQAIFEERRRRAKNMTQIEKPDLLKGLYVQLPVKSITAHPDNPRKDLGDLSELGPKHQGQRRTAKPDRCAVPGRKRPSAPRPGIAASSATGVWRRQRWRGLTEVPCVIAHMTQHTQLKTMIMENMQRADLTPDRTGRGFPDDDRYGGRRIGHFQGNRASAIRPSGDG